MSEDWTEADEALDNCRIKFNTLLERDLAETAGASPNQSTVFHYTDVKGALGILRSGRLWFTERSHLNDPVEIKYGFDIAYELFDVAAKRRPKTVPKDTALHLRGEHSYSLATNGFWVARFRLDGDDLVQWRNYADNGRGICFGFSTQKLDVNEFAKPIQYAPNRLRFPVSYEKDALCSRVQVYIDFGLELLEKVSLGKRDSYYKPYGRALLFERDFFCYLK
jgi:hypothetical protein